MSLINKFEILSSIWFDISLRVVLGITFVQLEKSEPFTRKIHEEELWLYKNPITDSYVPTTVLWPLVFTTPMMAVLSMFLLHKDKIDFYQAVLCITLALGLNGLFTDIIKIIVGRPRPDFFWRCFPDGKMNLDFVCTGNPISIRDGKKSFPSGHSSFAFTSFGFVALYLAGKLHTFGSRGKGQSWKLCLFFIPILIALVIALSRTCDYHHHWQDVLVGGMIGSGLTYVCYRHYYPPLDSQVSHKPYAELVPRSEKEKSSKGEDVKWI